MTTYPVVGGRANERVLMVVLNTAENGRWLFYAPSVMQREMNVESSCDYQDYRDFRGNAILRMVSREVIISNELYVLSSDDVAFNLIALDSQQKRTVKKEEVEKLFGCHIDG